MSTNFYKKLFVFGVATLCPICLIVSYSLFDQMAFSKTIQFCVVLAIFFCTVSTILCYQFGIRTGYKISLILDVCATFFVVLYLWMYSNNLIYVFSSVDAFRNYILSTGSAGIIVYIIIQTLQVVVLPIPAAVICLTGAIVYGPLFGSLYCSIGVIIGSIISFWIGRLFGYRVVVWVAGRQNAIKYAGLLTNKGKTFLPLAFLLPLFPDDILCLISGITTMKFSYFFWVTTIFRPISVIFMSFFGGGYIIPFRGWGLYIWGVIIILMVVLVYLSTKYQNKIEMWVIKNFTKK